MSEITSETSSESTVELQNDFLRVAFEASIGATITSFQGRVNNSWVDIMRKAPEPLGRSSNGNFIMLPYSNRIRDAVFTFNDKRHQLEKAEKHAIHGDVRDRPWKVKEQCSTSAVLEIRSEDFPDFNFPFPIRAEVTYTLDGPSLHVDLLLENCSETDMPAGFGLHPYFNKSLGDSDEQPLLSFSAEGFYSYEGELPIADGNLEDTPPSHSFAQKRDVTEGIDHCYGGWSGSAEIEWPASNVRLNISSDKTMSHAILFTPPEQSFFAFEPASMRTDGFNALNRGDKNSGVMVLGPGESLRSRTSFTVSQG